MSVLSNANIMQFFLNPSFFIIVLEIINKESFVIDEICLQYTPTIIKDIADHATNGITDDVAPTERRTYHNP